MSLPPTWNLSSHQANATSLKCPGQRSEAEGEIYKRVKGSVWQRFEKVCIQRFTEKILTDFFYASYVLYVKYLYLVYCINPMIIWLMMSFNLN